MATEIAVGQNRTLITANGTTQIKSKPGKFAKLIIRGVGTAWVLAFYDDTGSGGEEVCEWLTADGKVALDLQIPMYYGIRLVASGTTAGAALIIWS